MDNEVEMNIQTYVSYWFPFVVLKLASPQTKACFRNLEINFKTPQENWAATEIQQNV